MPMRSFISQDPHHIVGHPALKEAAGSETYLVEFKPMSDDRSIGIFETDNTRVADALSTLIDRGNLVNVKDVTAKVVIDPTFTPTTPIASPGSPVAEVTSGVPGDQGGQVAPAGATADGAPAPEGQAPAPRPRTPRAPKATPADPATSPVGDTGTPPDGAPAPEGQGGEAQ